MKAAELKNKSEKELREMMNEKRDELRALLFQAREHQLKGVHQIMKTRRLIARLMTVLRTKQAAQS